MVLQCVEHQQGTRDFTGFLLKGLLIVDSTQLPRGWGSSAPGNLEFVGFSGMHALWEGFRVSTSWNTEAKIGIRSRNTNPIWGRSFVTPSFLGRPALAQHQHPHDLRHKVSRMWFQFLFGGKGSPWFSFASCETRFQPFFGQQMYSGFVDSFDSETN